MTIDRDDPEGRTPSEDCEQAEARRRHGENLARLYDWARDEIGPMLLRSGLSQRAADRIVEEALQEYVTFSRSVAYPPMFVGKRIICKADEYKRLHGIHGSLESEGEIPHMLEVLRTKVALDTLPPRARQAIRILFHEKKSYAETAKALGLTIAAARHLVIQALKQLEQWKPPREAGE